MSIFFKNYIAECKESGTAKIVDENFSQNFEKFVLNLPWCSVTHSRLDWDKVKNSKIIPVDEYGFVDFSKAKSLSVFNEPRIFVIASSDIPAIAFDRDVLIEEWENILNSATGLICLYFSSERKADGSYLFAEYDERNYLAGV